MKNLRAQHSGFTYIGLLLLVALMGVGLAVIGQSWYANVQREKEADLLFIGEQFKRAIKLYYDGTPGGDKRLPKTLEDLVRDTRYPVVRRYLRKIYTDPMRGKAEWGLVSLKDGIVGVYSLSNDVVPFKMRSTTAKASNKGYSDWKFVADIAFAPPLVASATLVQPPPVPPVPEGASSPLPQTEVPPEQSKPLPRLPTERCERLRVADARACAASAVRAGGSYPPCEASAASRYDNCLAGISAIGPLSFKP